MHDFRQAMGRHLAALFEAPISRVRAGRTLAIAEVVLYLAPDRSGFTTGSFLTADGGPSA
jgi:NAD(P)-dependent dehydrogenase (short-subunit alcohol dehydrogenase family)